MRFSRSVGQLLRVGFSVSAVCLASAAMPVLAQDAEGGDDSGVGTIVVTAQFRDQDIQETPLAITAVDASLMDARSQTNIEQVAQRAPSVQLTAGGQGGGAQTIAANIRGIGQTDFQFPSEPGVGLYIDDVYYGISFGGAFDLVDLDRVEILRGPQGTLSGKNSIGGSIKLFSRRPDDDPDAYIEVSAGSFDRLAFRAASNMTISPDRLYLRLSGMARYVDGYVQRLDYECVTGDPAPGGTFATGGEDCVIGTEGGQNVVGGRAALRWIVNDRIENNLVVDVTRDRSEASAAKSIFLPTVFDPNGNSYVTGPRDYTNYATYTSYPGEAQQYTNPAESFLNAWGMANTLEIELTDDLFFTSITAFRHADGSSSWDGDNSPLSLSNTTSIFEHDQFTQEVRISANIQEFLELTAGGYYYHGDSRVGGRINVGVAGLDFYSDDPFKQESYSAFLHGVVHVTDSFNLTGGIRYTNEDKTYTFVRRSPIAGLPTDFRVAPLDGLQASFQGDRVDWRIAADYEVVPDVRLYGQVATGFKGGGVNPRPFYQSQLVSYDQEAATSYEVGLKTMLFDRALRLNSAYYHTDYSGYQGVVSACPDLTPEFLPQFCAATRNIGDARIDGFEVEFDARPIDGLSIDGSVSYTDFRFVSGLVGSGILAGVTRAPFVSDWKYAIGAQYELQVDGVGSFTPRLDWEWQSDMESNIPNSIPGFTAGNVESRGLLNARLTYRTEDEAWEASVAATNLTDEFYYLNKYDRVSQSGNAYGMPGRPREVIFTLRRSFF